MVSPGRQTNSNTVWQHGPAEPLINLLCDIMLLHLWASVVEGFFCFLFFIPRGLGQSIEFSGVL